MQESDSQKFIDAERKGLIRFHDERKRIEYVALKRTERFSDPEEVVRALYYIDLITKYNYPSNRIEMETEMPSRVPRFFADIVVYSDDQRKKPYIVVECKTDGVSDAAFEQATKQAIGNARVLSAPFAVCVAGNTQRAIETANWNDKSPEDATLADIPISYGNIELWRFKKADPNWELKTVEKMELVRALEKSHNTLWGGGKRSATVAFDELCKIIFVKIRDEKRHRKDGDPYDFQVKTHESSRGVYNRIAAIYQEAKLKDPEVFTEDIKVTEHELYAVVQHLQELSLSGTDLDTKGVAFEKFMDDFFKGKNGQFFTPRAIVKFAVKLMGINNEDSVLDPACGSGGFLLYALDAIREQATVIYGTNPAGQAQNDFYRYWHDFAEKKLYGIELNDSLARVAKMNMIIHDDGHTNVICHDGLASLDSMNRKNQGFGAQKFDSILTNPPFGASVKQSEHHYISEYELGRNGKKTRNTQKTEILFLERCTDFLKPGTGKLAIVLPDSIFINKTLDYVRTYIYENYTVNAVISLPSFAFSHYGADVKSSILFATKKERREITNDQIFMASLSNIGYGPTGKSLAGSELPSIELEYSKFEKNSDGYSVPAELSNTIFIGSVNEAIASNRMDVNAFNPVYLDLKDRLNEKTGKHLSKIIVDSKAGDWGDDPSKIGELDNVTECLVIRNTNFDNNYILNFDDTAMRLIKDSKLDGLALKEGDILIEKSGGSPAQPVGRVALVQNLPTEYPVVYSNFLHRIRVNTKEYDPRFVYTYLDTLYRLGYMQYIQNQTTGIKNLLMDHFEEIKMPSLSLDEQSEIADNYLEMIQKTQLEINKLSSSLNEKRVGMAQMVLND